MFSQIDHTAEIATCAYFLGLQRTDKVNRNYFSSVEKRRIFSARTSQTYMRQSQSACPACCAFLSRRARLPWDAQKMCAVTVVGTVLKVMSQDNLSILVITIQTYTHADIIIKFNYIIILFQANNIKSLCETITETTRTTCPSLLHEATAIQKKLESLLNLFAQCHSKYNFSEVVEMCKVPKKLWDLQCFTSHEFH